jgi:hypothetical protein
MGSEAGLRWQELRLQPEELQHYLINCLRQFEHPGGYKTGQQPIITVG